METETNNIKSETIGNMQNMVIAELKQWPGLLIHLFKSPETAIQQLPTSGSWMRPVVFSAASGLLSGVVVFFLIVRFNFSMALAEIIQMPIVSVVGIFIGGAILNFVITAMGKDPMMYRTIFLISILSGINAIGQVLSHFTFFAWYGVCAAMLFAIYHYAQIAGGLTKKNALILISVMGGLGILSFSGLMLGLGMMSSLPY